MDRWIRHFARVMGLIVCFLAVGIVRTYEKFPDLLPLEITVLSLMALLAIFICCAGIILSSLPPKKKK